MVDQDWAFQKMDGQLFHSLVEWYFVVVCVHHCLMWGPIDEYQTLDFVSEAMETTLCVQKVDTIDRNKRGCN